MSEKEKSLLSARLRLLRVATGMRQEEVAQVLGVSRSSYTYYELSRSKPDYDTLISLAKLFRVSIDYLVGMTRLPGDREAVADDIAEQEMVQETTLAGLTPDERKLVCLYRQLSTDRQEECLKELQKK